MCTFLCFCKLTATTKHNTTMQLLSHVQRHLYSHYHYQNHVWFYAMGYTYSYIQNSRFPLKSTQIYFIILMLLVGDVVCKKPILNSQISNLHFEATPSNHFSQIQTPHHSTPPIRGPTTITDYIYSCITISLFK